MVRGEELPRFSCWAGLGLHRRYRLPGQASASPSSSSSVKATNSLPAGDPTAYGIRGTVIALRKQDAARVRVRL